MPQSKKNLNKISKHLSYLTPESFSCFCSDKSWERKRNYISLLKWRKKLPGIILPGCLDLQILWMDKRGICHKQISRGIMT